MGEMAYMQAQDPMCVDQVFQVEDANFDNNRGYVFRPNNNLPTHYNPGLRNHENLSYGNQGNFQDPHQNFSSQNAPPRFQGQGASCSSFQGQKKQSSFKESILAWLKEANSKTENHENQLSNMEGTMSTMKSKVTNIKAFVKDLENQIR